MKNQYFGDIIDLFKYDLLETLNEELKLKGISFIPMLTGHNEEKKNDGNKRKFNGKAGSNNIELSWFLTPFKLESIRNFKAIEHYFEGKKIKLKILAEEEFKHESRSDYFKNIDKKNLNKQVIFFDPDNGMEVKKNTHQHLLHGELRQFYSKMSVDSVIVVIQFRPLRTNWTSTINDKIKTVKGVTEFVSFIRNGQVGFFVFSKHKTTATAVQIVLKKYKEQYNFLKINHE